MNASRYRLLIALAHLCAVAACGAPPAPQPGRVAASVPPPGARPAAPAIAPSVPPAPPSPSASALAAVTAAPAPTPPVIVIHEAELYGALHARAGKTVTISSKVITSTTEPEIGNKGVLYQRLDNSSSKDVWVPVADCVVKTKLDKQSEISVTITDEKKEFPAGQKVNPFAPKSRMRLRWEWQ
jgi:hypothetical protein